jgi:lysophospholipase L1-like esterase
MKIPKITRKAIGRIALVALGILLPLAIGEIVVRVAGIKYISMYEFHKATHKKYHHANAEMIYSGAPGLRQEFIVRVRFNSFGYHENEYPQAKPPGTFRIVILGDSFVEAFQVTIGKTFHKLLEERLNRDSKGMRFEVISFGVSGVGQTGEYRILRDLAQKFSPDLVIAEFLGCNDVRDNSNKLTALSNSPEESGQILSSKSFVFYYSRFLMMVNALANQAYARRMNRRRISSDTKVYIRNNDDPLWQEAWALTEKSVLDMKEVCGQIGAKLWVISFTSPYEIDMYSEPPRSLDELFKEYPKAKEYEWDFQLPDKRMAEICRRNGIFHFSLNPYFMKLQKETGRKAHVQGYLREAAGARLRESDSVKIARKRDNALY